MEYDARTLWTVVIVIVAAVAYRYLPRLQARSPFVDPEVPKRRLDAGEDVVIIDVRTPGEFNGRGGHIPGAINVPMGDLRARLAARDGDLLSLKDQPVYVHCLMAGRASRSARALRDAGFTDVSVIKGGIRRWRRSRFPIEGRG